MPRLSRNALPFEIALVTGAALLVGQSMLAGTPKVRATIQELFADQMYRRVAVSPGGQYVASEFYSDGHFRVAVKDIDGGIDKNIFMIERYSYDPRITQLFWADSDSLLITVERSSRELGYDRESVTYVADIQSQDDRLKGRFFEVATRGVVVDPLPAIPNQILYSPTSEPSSVYRVELAELPAYTGEDRKVDKELSLADSARVAQLDDHVASWITDAGGHVRSAMAISEDPFELRIWYRANDSAKWVIALREADPERFGDVIPLGISDDGAKILVASNRGRDRYGLYEYDPITREFGDLLYEHPTAEIVAVSYDYFGARILGAIYVESGIVRYAYLDTGDQADRARIREAFPEHTVVTTSTSANRRRVTVRESSPTNPGIFYFFDMDTGKIIEIGRAAPWLNNNKLGDMRAFHVRSKDGTEVEAFLAEPPFAEDTPPLVVLPHGGPIGVMDSRSFNPQVQYLARSGFAVLQVNYRGSGGYGRAFEEAGSREWGRGIEDDIDAAVDFVLEKGWADRERMCVVGASYGGYSALMSAIRHPDRYRCAAVFAAVTDLALLYNSSDWAMNEYSREHMNEVIGDPNSEYEELREYSPIYHTDKIRIPVFITHGLNDRRVDIEHAYRLRAMFDLYGTAYEWKLLKKSGHGFDSAGDEIQYYIRLREFLADHLE